MNIVKLALVAALVFVMCVEGVSSQTRPMRFGHASSPTSLPGLSAGNFKMCMDERTSGQIDVQIYPMGQLGNVWNLFEMAQAGAADLTLVPSYILVEVAPLFGVFDLPFFIGSRDKMRRIVDEHHLSLEDVGLRLISVWEYGFMHISNSVRPIDVPSDLQGISVRAVSDATENYFNMIGANAERMAFQVSIGALQAGIIDGQEGTLHTFAARGYAEIQRFVTIIGHSYHPAFVVMNEHYFQSLPDDQKQVLIECAAATRDWTYQEADRSESELLADIRDAGVSVNIARRADFIEVVKPMYDEFMNSVDGASMLIDRFYPLQCEEDECDCGDGTCSDLCCASVFR